MREELIDRLDSIEQQSARLRKLLERREPNSLKMTFAFCKLCADVDDMARRLATYSNDLSAPDAPR
jgi:hypothetical protein